MNVALQDAIMMGQHHRHTKHITCMSQAMLRAFQKRKAKLPVCGAALLDPTGVRPCAHILPHITCACASHMPQQHCVAPTHGHLCIRKPHPTRAHAPGSQRAHGHACHTMPGSQRAHATRAAGGMPSDRQAKGCQARGGLASRHSALLTLPALCSTNSDANPRTNSDLTPRFESSDGEGHEP